MQTPFNPFPPESPAPALPLMYWLARESCDVFVLAVKMLKEQKSLRSLTTVHASVLLYFEDPFVAISCDTKFQRPFKDHTLQSVVTNCLVSGGCLK